MSKTKTTKPKSKRTRGKRLTMRQHFALEVARHMVDTSPIPAFPDNEAGAAALKEERFRRADNALYIACHMIDLVRENL